MIWFETSCVQYNRWPIGYIFISPSPSIKVAIVGERIIYFATNYFFIFHHGLSPFFAPITVADSGHRGIYAFPHTPEIFKCEALLAMP